jgi:hypothetical protein
VACELVRFSLVERCNGVCLGSAPACALDLILKDYNVNTVPS